jgi:hypothetical protein
MLVDATHVCLSFHQFETAYTTLVLNQLCHPFGVGVLTRIHFFLHHSIPSCIAPDTVYVIGYSSSSTIILSLSRFAADRASQSNKRISETIIMMNNNDYTPERV